MGTTCQVAGGDGYDSAIGRSYCLLTVKFDDEAKDHPRFFWDHCPQIAHRQAIEEMEREWEDEWRTTTNSRAQDGSNIFWGSLQLNYLLETNRATPSRKHPHDSVRFGEISLVICLHDIVVPPHTYMYDVCTCSNIIDVSDAQPTALKVRSIPTRQGSALARATVLPPTPQTKLSPVSNPGWRHPSGRGGG